MLLVASLETRGQAMGKYDALHAYLRRRPRSEIELSFRDIEHVIKAMLPNSASNPQWWCNANGSAAGHVQTRAWLEAGFEAFLVEGKDRVKFVRRRET